ncbi:hypothetical protein MCOR25_010912 [Pyricularia grisea]|nr:hypothetical protein MCOR25_010912 [Pyricularia grisea]
MTSSSPIQASAAKPDTAAARKRRRRAPAGGASDDCFACTKRNVKCDRRRPYCSQCLEVGNECSGYKTQLTWGVGVASRGKLRGLSLPIAKAPPVSAAVKKSSPTRTRAATTTSNMTSAAAAGHWHNPEDMITSSPRRRPVNLHISLPVPEQSSSISSPTTPYLAHYDPRRVGRTADTTPTAAPHNHWSQMPFSASLPTDGFRYGKLGGHQGMPMDSMHDMDHYHLSPMSHSFPREDVPFLHSPVVLYDGFNGHNSPAVTPSPLATMIMEQRTAPTSCPSLVYAPSEHSTSVHSHSESYDVHLSNKLMLDCDSIVGTPDLDTYSSSVHSNGHFWGPSPPAEDTTSCQDSHPQSSSWPSTVETPGAHVSAELISKMPFFLDYYEHTMCPSMVFIDGPNNPFRDHIMQLATGSRSLQHAICALAACNLRTKRKLSLGQHSPAEKFKRSCSPEAEDQSMQEEYEHRNLAVHLLNEQLNDVSKSKHDSVLATILMLCHYRMAESGIARFHTQFAGVKKILQMRRTTSFPPSNESAWMEALFTYFDAISASINDREAQLDGSFFGFSPEAMLLPQGAENLVGCDRELFTIIVKLGRLNLLSQHRPVQNNDAALGSSVPRSESPFSAPLGHVYKPSNNMNVDVFGTGGGPIRFDGNGFGNTLGDDELLSAAISTSAPTYDSQRSTFWREWKEARASLQAWSFDAQRVTASLQQTGLQPTPAQIRDLSSLSEAFRYAALLYTERLASPQTPSSHNNFRNLVSQVVYYATSLESGSSAEKFLLWPLFVAGSECVNELQQNIVRSKCRDIMARSGYMNNMSALEILERLWSGETTADDDYIGSGRHINILNNNNNVRLPSLTRSSPFNWGKCIGGPGVEVEWIMF